MKGSSSSESAISLKVNVRISDKPGALHAVISTVSGRSTSQASNVSGSFRNRSIGGSSFYKSGAYGSSRQTVNKSILSQSNFIPAYNVVASPIQ